MVHYCLQKIEVRSSEEPKCKTPTAEVIDDPADASVNTTTEESAGVVQEAAAAASSAPVNEEPKKKEKVPLNSNVHRDMTGCQIKLHNFFCKIPDLTLLMCWYAMRTDHMFLHHSFDYRSENRLQSF